MFGYVTPLKDELKVAQFEDFRSYYCGLCQHIRRDYGQLPRLILNYDMTALALLLDGLSPHKSYIRRQICLTHPHKKKPMIINNDALSYAGAMNVALVYYKLLDDVQDDKDLKSKALAASLKPYKNKFPREINPILKMIETNLQSLYHLEATKEFSSLDEISDPFAQIVANILVMYPYELREDNAELRQQLYQFGYALGKWIYLIDALDDLETDLKNDKFNPLLHLYQQENESYEQLLSRVSEPVTFTLLNCGYVCKSVLKRLPLIRSRALLNNIVVLGMMDQYTKVTSSCHCKKKAGR